MGQRDDLSLQGWIFQKVFLPWASPIRCFARLRDSFCSAVAGSDVDSLLEEDFH